MSWTASQLDPEYPFDLVAPKFTITPEQTALLVIDMQTDYLTIKPDSPVGAAHPELATGFNERVSATVLPTLKSLIDGFRNAHLPVVYTRNGAMTTTGEEMTPRLKALQSPPQIRRGLPGYEIDPAIQPVDGELVIDKLTSGAFTHSQLDHALRNQGVTDLIVTGVFTDMCVLGTARVGAELGYNVVICEDACASLTRRAHDEGLLVHARRFGRVAGSEEIRSEMGLGG